MVSKKEPEHDSGNSQPVHIVRYAKVHSEEFI